MTYRFRTDVVRRDDGFSLIELIAVIAIVTVLSAIISVTFIKYLEKSKEAKDLTAVRVAYTTVMAAVINEEGEGSGIYNETKERYEISVPLSQTHEGWSTKGELLVGDISSETDSGRQWFGNPGKNGNCLVYYNNDRGIVIVWNEGAEIELSDEILPYFTGYYFETEGLKKSKESTSELDYSRCATTGEFIIHSGDKLTIGAHDELVELKEYEVIIYNESGILYNSGPVTGSWTRVLDKGINGAKLADYVSVVDDTVNQATWYTFKNECKIAINYIFDTEDAANRAKTGMAGKFRVDRKR